MKLPPIGARGHQLPRHTRHAERVRDLEKIADILLTTGSSEPIAAGGFALPGEEMTLRCIPVTTRGVGSCIPDTNPLDALIAKENHLERHGQRLIPRRHHQTVLL